MQLSSEYLDNTIFLMRGWRAGGRECNGGDGVRLTDELDVDEGERGMCGLAGKGGQSGRGQWT